MTYPYNPLGFCILSSQDFDADLAYWKRLRPHAMLFTQQMFALVAPALATIPELKVAIIRTVDDAVEKTLHRSGKTGYERMIQDFLTLCEYEALDINRTYLYIWNEPDLNSGETAGMLQWTIDLMRHAKDHGVHCVVLNIGMATLSKERMQSSLFDGIHHELADGWHILGMDEHAGFIPPAGAAGRSPDMYLNKGLAQQDHWPSPYDVQVGSVDGNWYVGRLFWWLQCCDQLGVKHPRIIITEFGCDDMIDLNTAKLSDGSTVNIRETLENRYAHWETVDGKTVFLRAPWPHPGIRGVDTLRWLWNDYYPQWTFGMTHWKFTEWQLWVYDDPAPDGKPYIEAALEFASCPGHPEWDKTYGENATADPEYRQLTVNYADAIYDAAKPEPLPDSDPDPEPMPTGKPRQALVLSIILILACIAVALRDIWLLAHQAQAQGVTMETLQIMPVNEAGEVLLAAIMAILAGGLSSPVTTPVVNVIKLILRRIGKEKAVGGNVIAAIVAMVVTVIIWVSRWAGVELDVNNLLDLLTTIIPPVLTFVGLIAGQKRLYNWAVQKEIPAYGYQRSE